MIKSDTLAATHIMVFIVTALIPQLNAIRSAHVATGFGNIIGNKGATQVSFNLGKTSFHFINAHLASGMKKQAERTKSFERILNDNQISRRSPVKVFPGPIDQHTFFFGDLN